MANYVCVIEVYGMENMLFQQDGATCYITRSNIGLLQLTFPGCVISHRGNINWPPDYTICHYSTFLWVYAKDRVYEDKLSSLKLFNTNIRRYDRDTA